MHHTKTLGVAIMAILALAGLTASAASASQFKSAAYPTTISGAQEGKNVLTVEAGLQAKCNKATFTGSASADSSTLTLTPLYEECTFAGLNATINVVNCSYVFHAGALVAADDYDGTLDIACTGGSTIVILTATCEIQIGSHSGLTAVGFTDETAAGMVTAETVLTGIAYTKKKDGLLCPLAGTGVKADGKYEGSVTYSGSAGAIRVE